MILVERSGDSGNGCDIEVHMYGQYSMVSHEIKTRKMYIYITRKIVLIILVLHPA